MGRLVIDYGTHYATLTIDNVASSTAAGVGTGMVEVYGNFEYAEPVVDYSLPSDTELYEIERVYEHKQWPLKTFDQEVPVPPG